MGFNVILTQSMSNSVYALQQISNLMTESTNTLATGKDVNSALDDPINYFASQDHLYRANDLDSRTDEMAEAIELVNAADTGIEGILDLIDAAYSIGQTAQTASDQAELNSLEDQFNDLMEQIDQMAEDSYYKGTNLLGGLTETLTVQFNADGTNSLTLTGQDASSSGLGITTLTTDDWFNTSGGVPDDTAIQGSLDELTDAKAELRTMSKTLSMQLSIIETRQSFTDEMVTILNNGASDLTAADTNAESAKLLMLQTQQSLSTNSLSIATDSYSSILSLFQ